MSILVPYNDFNFSSVGKTSCDNVRPVITELSGYSISTFTLRPGRIYISSIKSISLLTFGTSITTVAVFNKPML